MARDKVAGRTGSFGKIDRLIHERRAQTHTLGWLNGVARIFRRVFYTRQFTAGGHDVYNMTDLVAELATGGDAGRPVDNQRGGDAALIHPAFELAKWSI